MAMDRNAKGTPFGSGALLSGRVNAASSASFATVGINAWDAIGDDIKKLKAESTATDVPRAALTIKTPAGPVTTMSIDDCTPCGPGTVATSSGLTRCSNCDAGTSSNSRNDNCDACPSGKFSSKKGADFCTDCPEGRYASESGPTECKATDPGFHVPQPGASKQLPCPAGTYTTGTETVTCTPCGSSVVSPDRTREWDPNQEGLTTADDCNCDDGYTGSDCDQQDCDETLSMVSLGLVLVEGTYPEESWVKGDRAARDLGRVTMARKIEAILRTADTDGDDFLERAEVDVALKGADMHVPAEDIEGNNLPIWAYPETSLTSTWKAYDEYDVRVTTMIGQIVENFVQTGAFYPSDRDVWVSARNATNATMKEFSASYPNSTWSTDDCDVMRINGTVVAWSFQDDRHMPQKNLPLAPRQDSRRPGRCGIVRLRRRRHHHGRPSDEICNQIRTPVPRGRDIEHRWESTSNNLRRGPARRLGPSLPGLFLWPTRDVPGVRPPDP